MGDILGQGEFSIGVLQLKPTLDIVFGDSGHFWEAQNREYSVFLPESPFVLPDGS
jgi:hypothetical protein